MSSSRYRADSVVSWLLVAWENTDVLPSNRWAWNGPVSDSTSMCFKHQQNAILHCMDLAFWASAQSIFTLVKCGKAPKTCLSEGKVIHRFCRGEEIDNTLDLNPVIEIQKKLFVAVKMLQIFSCLWNGVKCILKKSIGIRNWLAPHLNEMDLA